MTIVNKLAVNLSAYFIAVFAGEHLREHNMGPIIIDLPIGFPINNIISLWDLRT